MPRLVYGLIVICLITILFIVVAYGLLIAFTLRTGTDDAYSTPKLLPKALLSFAPANAGATAGFVSAFCPTPHGGPGTEARSLDAGRVQVAQEPQSSANQEPQGLAKAVTTIEGDRLVVTVVQLPKPKPEEPELVGEKNFRAHFRAALNELYVYDRDAYDLVCRYVVKIIEDNERCSDCTALVMPDCGIVYARTPTHPPQYQGPTYDGRYGWTSDIPIYAAVLVHEAIHVYLYQTQGLLGVEAEKICLAESIQTLGRLQLAPKVFDGLVKAMNDVFKDRYGIEPAPVPQPPKF